VKDGWRGQKPVLDAKLHEWYHDVRNDIMLRTQIQLTEKQASQLKTLASRRWVSMAELIRQGVDLVLSHGGEISSAEIRHKAQEAAGRFRSGTHDGSVRHDEYLSKEYAG